MIFQIITKYFLLQIEFMGRLDLCDDSLSHILFTNNLFRIMPSKTVYNIYWISFIWNMSRYFTLSLSLLLVRDPRLPPHIRGPENIFCPISGYCAFKIVRWGAYCVILQKMIQKWVNLIFKFNMYLTALFMITILPNLKP